MNKSDRANVSRANGSKSRGPVTAAGKKKSRMNAVTHGLFARVIDAGQLSAFADRSEFATAVQRITADLGVRTMMGRSLTELLVTDMLRLRHCGAMEMAVFAPSEGFDSALKAELSDRESGLHFQESASGGCGDEEIEILLQAYAEAEKIVNAEGRLGFDGETLRLMSADLWRIMNEARPRLERDQEELRRADAALATADAALATNLATADGALATNLTANDATIVTADGESRADLLMMRAMRLENLTESEQYLRATDKSVFLVRREADITAVLAGRRRIAPEIRAAWSSLFARRQDLMNKARRSVVSADARIAELRHCLLLASVKKLGNLNLLGTYEERIRRSMSKTLAMIRDVEGGGKGVIDLQ